MPTHLGHDLVGHDDGNRQAILESIIDDLDGLRARRRDLDQRLAPERAMQDPMQCLEDARIVINTEDDGALGRAWSLSIKLQSSVLRPSSTGVR